MPQSAAPITPRKKFRPVRVVLNTLLVGIAVIAIIGGVAVWRLSLGPVSLNFLTGHIEDIYQDADLDGRLDLGDIVLVWDAANNEVDLRARNVRLIDDQDKPRLALDAVNVKFSIEGLLRGVLAVRTLEAEGPRIEVIRTANGDIRISGISQGGLSRDLGEVDAGQVTSGSRPGTDFLDEILKEPSFDRPVDYLQEIRIVDGLLSIDDREFGNVRSIPISNAVVRRHEQGLAGDIDIEIGSGAETARIRLEAVYDKDEATINISGTFSDLRPSAKMPLVPELQSLSGLDIALDGSIKGTIGADGTIWSLDLTVDSGGGNLESPPVFSKPLPIATISGHASYDDEESQLTVDSLALALGTAEQPGPEILISARASGLRGDVEVSANINLDGLDMEAADLYWPPGLAGNAREWVTSNIQAGTVQRASVELALVAPDGDFDEALMRRFSANLTYRDLVVHYLRPITPVTGVDGTAEFDSKGVRFRISSGATLGDIRVTGAELAIQGFDAAEETMALDIGLEGEMQPLLKFLDHPRLDLLDGLGSQVKKTTGDFAARLRLDVPRLAHIESDGLDIKIESKSNQLALGEPIPGQTLEDMSLTLDHSGSIWQTIRVQGKTSGGGRAGTEGPDAGAIDGSNLARDFDIDYSRTAAGTYALTVAAKDTGALLRALNAGTDLAGGRLLIKGNTGGTNAEGSLRGTIEINDVTALKKSFLARILAASSFVGLWNLVSQEGVPFRRVHGNFTIDSNVIEIESMRADADTLKGTATGWVDLEQEKMALGGTIVPIDRLNRLLTNIPLVRRLFSEEGGLVAIQYELNGPLHDPKIKVKPLRSLTPRLIENLIGTAPD